MLLFSAHQIYTKHFTGDIMSDINRKHGKRKFLFVKILILIVLVLAIACGCAYYYLNSELNKINRNVSIEDSEYDITEVLNYFGTDDKYGITETDDVELLNDSHVKNILLIGQDRRTGDKKYQRSDVIMIYSINTKTDEISLVSIMRDLYVPIYVSEDEIMYGPINYSLLRGGPTCLCKTIESDFGITLDGYMLVDFYQFVDALNELEDGTLDIELTQEEADYLNTHNSWESQAGATNIDWTLHEGTNTMSSEQVLSYCRLRYIDNDFHRVERQQATINAIYNKLSKEDIKEILQYINDVLPHMYTDLTNKEIIKYAYTMYKSGMKIKNTYRLPIDDSYTQEIVNDENYANGSDLHLIIPDMDKNVEAIQKYLYDYD